MNKDSQYIGIDISMDTFSVSFADKQYAELANTGSGFKKFLKKLPEEGIRSFLWGVAGSGEYFLESIA